MPTDPWWNFFSLCGSAAATLTGLMFVAATLGTTLIHQGNLEGALEQRGWTWG